VTKIIMYSKQLEWLGISIQNESQTYRCFFRTATRSDRDVQPTSPQDGRK